MRRAGNTVRSWRWPAHEPEETCFCSVFGIDCADPKADVSAWLIDGILYWEAVTKKGEALTEAVREL